MVKYLIWLNPQNGTYCIRYCRYVSIYDIDDTDKYGHVLVNILHLDFHEKKFFSMSFHDYTEFEEKQLNKFLAHDRKINFKRNLLISISNLLIKIANDIRNKLER